MIKSVMIIRIETMSTIIRSSIAMVYCSITAIMRITNAMTMTVVASVTADTVAIAKSVNTTFFGFLIR